LTIGSIHGGTAPNIIPSKVELLGTLRTFNRELRERLLEQIETDLRLVAARFRLDATITPRDSTRACVNDAAMTELVHNSAVRLFGSEAINPNVRTAGADDMSVFLDRVPGCYFVVGSSNQDRGLNSPHHSPGFDFDEKALDIGADLMAQVALDYLAGRR
jgi:amidohydrolase